MAVLGGVAYGSEAARKWVTRLDPDYHGPAMRIQCQSCQSKYTIGDEKIGKKVVQLRCKKCSAIIVIDGNAAMPEDTAAQSASDKESAPAEQWTVNVADGDQRTLTAAEIAREYASGVVGDETYCWKDGMDDWLPIREIEPLYTLAKATPKAAEVPASGVDADSKSAPPPRLDPEPTAPVPTALRDGGRGRGADLFANAEKAGSEDEGIVTKAAPSPAPPAPSRKSAAADSPKLTGARAENSVLFSLSSLTGESAGKEGDSASSSSTSSSSSSSSSSEASGLLDLRSLSAKADGGGPPKPVGSKESRVDDIMNLSGGGAFGTALAAPVLGLQASEAASSSIAPAGESKSNRSLVPAILGGSALIAIAIVVAVVLGRTPAPQPTGTGPTATTTTSGTAPTSSIAAADSSTTATKPPVAVGTGEASATASSQAPPDKATRPVVAATGPAATGATAATGNKPEETAPAATATAPAATATAEKPQDFASALANAAGKADEKPAETTGGGGSATPFDRGAASAALAGVDVQGCKKPDGPTGPGHVMVTFAPDGSVASAVVDQGPFPSTPVGGCIAGKYRGARVPAFSGAAVRVGKSFTLN